MDEEKFGTVDDYKRVFEELRGEGIPKKHVALLKAHHGTKDRTATWAQLAESVGYQEGCAVNLQYGLFASRVARKLGIADRPRGYWIFDLVVWGPETEPETGHTTYRLLCPVAEALEQLGWVA